MLFNLRDRRVGLIHRIHPNMQLALFDSLDELWDPAPGTGTTTCASSTSRRSSARPAGALGVGAGAPPVPTDDGLLLFYHERDGDRSVHDEGRAARRRDRPGQVGAAGADHAPEVAWERFGDVDNVVFVQGAVARPDGTIYLTYGAADRCVGAATVDTAETPGRPANSPSEAQPERTIRTAVGLFPANLRPREVPGAPGKPDVPHAGARVVSARPPAGRQRPTLAP